MKKENIFEMNDEIVWDSIWTQHCFKTFEICNSNEPNSLGQCKSTDDCDNGEECISDTCIIKGKSFLQLQLLSM